MDSASDASLASGVTPPFAEGFSLFFVTRCALAPPSLPLCTSRFRFPPGFAVLIVFDVASLSEES